MTVDDMLNAIGLTGVLFYFLAPTIIVILCIYAYNRHKKRKEIQDRQKLSLKNSNKISHKEGEEILNDDTKAMKILDSAPLIPEQIGKFRGLTLEFDSSGHVKENK